MTSISNQIYQEAFSCTSLRVHPLNTHFVAQSNGNYIAIFGSEKPWRLDKRKVNFVLIVIIIIIVF